MRNWLVPLERKTSPKICRMVGNLEAQESNVLVLVYVRRPENQEENQVRRPENRNV